MLADLSFKLYEDSALSIPFSGTLQLTHNSDLSEGAQDFVLYFGSTDSARELEANSNPGTDDIELSPTDLLPNWAAAVSRSLGDLIEPSTPNGYVYECTTSGTSHASTEPTWPTSGLGSTVTDGTAVWTFRGAKHLTTEIKLASTNDGLAGATPGAALSLGTNLAGGVANAEEIHIRITNAVTVIRNNAAHAEIGININEVIETAI